MATARHFANMLMRKLKISSTYIIKAIYNKNSLGNQQLHWLIIMYYIYIG